MKDTSLPGLKVSAALKALPVPQMLLDMMLGGGLYPRLEREGPIAPRAT